MKKILFLSTLYFLLFVLTGCVTEYNIATGEEEAIFYGTAKEVRVGESIAKKVEEDYLIVEDVELNNRLNTIAEKIVEVCDRKEIEYYFKVVDLKEEDKKDEPAINAFALPGGFVYIFKDLMDAVESDDQLAGVVAHEVGHIVAKHSIKKLQAVMGYMLLRVVSVAAGAGGIGQGADFAFQQIMLGYGRDDEILADRLAAKYTELAGYNPESIIDFLEYLHEVNMKGPIRKFTYNKTHPYIAERIVAVKRQLGMPLSFDDALNLN